MRFGRFFRMMRRMSMVAMSMMRMLRRRFVLPSFVVLGRLLVMLGGVLMVLRCFLVMLSRRMLVCCRHFSLRSLLELYGARRSTFQ